MDIDANIWNYIRTAPSYTKVAFAFNGSPTCEGLIRDRPTTGGPRRITNTTTGMELFANHTIEWDHFEVLEVPVGPDEVNAAAHALIGSVDAGIEHDVARLALTAGLAARSNMEISFG